MLCSSNNHFGIRISNLKKRSTFFLKCFLPRNVVTYTHKVRTNLAGVVAATQQILSLDTMPKCYQKYEKESWKSSGLRVLPVDNYVVLYIPDNNKKVVTILRVMYAGRDIDNQLNLHTKQ